MLGRSGGDRLAKFVAGDRLKEFISNELRQVTHDPIKFRTPNRQVAYGYEATVLADLCEAVQTLRMTPAMAAALENRAWSLEDLLGLLDRYPSN